MLIYGITGGIGSGKSTVAALIKERGFSVFDADAIGRELLAKNSALIREVHRYFPASILPNGEVDRRLLADLVFSDPTALRNLEALVHPAVWREVDERLKALQPQPALCFLEAALLADIDVPLPLVGLLLVTAPESVRIRRVRERDRVSQEQARSRMRAQSNDEHKKRKATYIIDNGGSLIETERKVEEFLQTIVRES